LPSFEVGVKIASASLILSTALTVSKSGSPGPQPMHESFMSWIVKNVVFKLKRMLLAIEFKNKIKTELKGIIINL